MKTQKPEDAHRLFVEAFNRADLEGMVALYEPDAVTFNRAEHLVRGTAPIREALRGFLELSAKIKLDTKSAIQSGELALLRSDWQMTGTGPDGKPFTIAHSSTEVVRRQPDGRWLYVIDHPFGADQMVAAKAQA